MHASQTDSRLKKGGKKERKKGKEGKKTTTTTTTTKKDSYLREGKSHCNCSNNNKMVPEPLPNSIQAASNVDFTLQSQTLSKRAKPSLLHVRGNCTVLET